MKKYIVIIFLFSFFIGFSQNNNQTDAKGLKQGVWIKKHSNGKVKYKGQFKDDKPVGTFLYFDKETGKLTLEMEHKGSSAYTKMYHINGAVMALGKYENQLKDSVWQFFSDKNILLSDEFYLSGKKEGTWKIYYKSGKLMEEKEYSLDFENGKWNQFFENGKQKMTATYENGSLEGKVYYFNAKGKKTIRGNFYHDVRHGTWMFFNPNGSELKREEYHMGKRIDENKDDVLLDTDKELREKQDVLEFEDMLPPR